MGQHESLPDAFSGAPWAAYAPDAFGARLYTALGLMRVWSHGAEPERAVDLGHALLAAAIAQDVPHWTARAELGLGLAYAEGPGGGRGEALAHFDAALTIAEAESDGYASAESARAIGRLQAALGRWEDAAIYDAAAAETLEALGDVDGGRACRVSQARALLRRGDPQGALDVLEPLEAELATAIAPDAWVRAAGVRALAGLPLGNVHDAPRLLEQASRLAAQLSSLQLVAEIQADFAEALLFLGQPERALGLVAESEAALAALPALDGHAIESRDLALRLLLLRAEAEAQTGAPAAGEAYADARARAADEESHAHLGTALLGLASLARHDGLPQEAEALALEARSLAQWGGVRPLETAAELFLGELALGRAGSRAAAREAFDRALGLTERTGALMPRAVALFGLARAASDVFQHNGWLARASEYLTIYLEQLTEASRQAFLRVAPRAAILAPPSFSFGAEPEPPRGRRPAEEPLPLADGLDEIFALVTSRLPLPELLARMNATFLRLSQASRAMVYLLNEDGVLTLRDRQNATSALALFGPAGPATGVIEQVRQTGATLWVTDALAHPVFAAIPEVSDYGLRGLLCIPLKLADAHGERVIGCLYADRQVPWLGVSERDLQMLERMARYVGVTIGVALLQDETAQQNQRLETLNHLARALASTLDPAELARLALECALQITQGEQACLFTGEPLARVAAYDRAGRAVPEMPVSQAVLSRVVGERRPLTILDVGEDAELAARDSLVIRNVRSVMGVPLVLDEKLVGVIYVSSSTAHKTFTRQDVEVLSAVGAQVAVALENARTVSAIKSLNANLESEVELRTRALQSAQEQLFEKEKLATVGTLAGGVAHEINNPLGAVLTNAQFLLLEIEDPEQRESLQLIEAGAKRCKEIVEALLRYAKPLQPRHEPVDLGGVVQETLAMLELACEEAGAELAVSLAPTRPLMGDPAELRQVVGNLLMNALEALGSATGPCRLQLALSESGGVITLVVRDSGQGMGPDVLKRIFDPFFTTKEVGAGTGLGLALCRRIVEKHGGRLFAESSPGEGATFTLAFATAAEKLVALAPEGAPSRL